MYKYLVFIFKIRVNSIIYLVLKVIYLNERYNVWQNNIKSQINLILKE